jgi:hypothetical protein
MKQRWSVILMVCFVLCIFFSGKTWASEREKSMGDMFDITYHTKKGVIHVRNSIVTDEKGVGLPYQVNCIVKEMNENSYEWFVKYPSSEYELVSTEKNPVLSIQRYGKVYIRLVLDGDHNLSKEYHVTSKVYMVESEESIVFDEVYNDTNDSLITKTVVERVNRYYAPTQSDLKMPIFQRNDSKVRGKSDFRITYQKEESTYNVTNGFLPETINELPYKVSLTNIGKQNTNYVWYIKNPGGSYVWMSDQQGASATIWNYGTIHFKLVINGDMRNAVNYSVTGLPQEKGKEIRKKLRERKSSKRKIGNVDFQLKISNEEGLFDVTDATLNPDYVTIPYTVYPINVTKGNMKCEWSIKKPWEKEYTAMEEKPFQVDYYGPVSLKLSVNNKEALATTKTITTYFENEEELRE